MQAWFANSCRAEPLSEAGVELIRGNDKQLGKPSYYRGMSEADQMSMNLAEFGGSVIQFDTQSGYGKLSEQNILPTDDLLFLEPGWAIGVIAISETLGSGLPLAEIALRCDLSPSHFLRAFKVATGKKPSAWRTERVTTEHRWHEPAKGVRARSDAVSRVQHC